MTDDALFLNDSLFLSRCLFTRVSWLFGRTLSYFLQSFVGTDDDRQLLCGSIFVILCFVSVLGILFSCLINSHNFYDSGRLFNHLAFVVLSFSLCYDFTCSSPFYRSHLKFMTENYAISQN